MIDPDSVFHARTITFDDQASSFGPGRPQNGVIVLPGAVFGKLFAGQTLMAEGNFDRIAGDPTLPLSVLPGPLPSLTIVRLIDTNVLSGFGPTGYPKPTATGEGAIAILFDRDQPSLRFDLRGGEGGAATVTFLRRDGTVIDAWVIEQLAEAAYAFEQNNRGGEIAGLIITNDDPDGIAFDTLEFEQTDQTS